MKILFVCLGNICRSPMAEGIFRGLADEYSLDVDFDSCGTGNWHIGQAPDQRAQQCVQRHDGNIGGLRGRQFHADDFDLFDRIYVMDTNNYADVLAQARTEADKTKVDMVLNSIYPAQNRSVPDPYYGDGDGFEKVHKMLSRAAKAILFELKNEIG